VISQFVLYRAAGTASETPRTLWTRRRRQRRDRETLLRYLDALSYPPPAWLCCAVEPPSSARERSEGDAEEWTAAYWESEDARRGEVRRGTRDRKRMRQARWRAGLGRPDQPQV